MPRVVVHGVDALLYPHFKTVIAVPQEQDGCRQAPTVKAGGIAGVNGIETVMKRIGHREARRAKYRCPMRST